MLVVVVVEVVVEVVMVILVMVPQDLKPRSWPSKLVLGRLKLPHVHLSFCFVFVLSQRHDLTDLSVQTSKEDQKEPWAKKRGSGTELSVSTAGTCKVTTKAKRRRRPSERRRRLSLSLNAVDGPLSDIDGVQLLQEQNYPIRQPELAK